MVILILLVLPSVSEVPHLAERWDLTHPTSVIPGEKKNFSGLAFTPRGTLLVVDDRGLIEEWSADARLERSVWLPGRPDIEDVCIDSDGRHALLVVEDTSVVLRIALETLAVVERFESPREVSRGKKGVEGLLVVEARSRRELWLGHQGSESIHALAWPSVGPSAEYARNIEIQDEARALTHDAATGGVLIAADDRKELRLLGPDGKDREAIPLPFGARTVEGLAIDDLGRLLMCTDGGDVVRFETKAVRASEAASSRAESIPRLVHLVDLDVPSFAPEIAAVSADRRHIAYIDDHWHTLEICDVDWREAGQGPVLSPRDLDEEWDGPQGVPFASAITSVAAHPNLPFVLVTTIGRHREAGGTITAVDLRAETLGKSLWFANAGRHPDSIAISPDGRWAVVANEGEGDDRSSVAPGSVTVLALHAIDPLTHRNFTGDVPTVELDVHAGVAIDAGDVEPEYVAIDPRSRFAVVTCQENDAAVVIALDSAEPRVLPTRFYLPAGAEPDGTAILDGFIDPTLGAGALVAFAEEGRFDRQGRWLGQAVSFHWIGPEDDWSRTELLSRVELPPIVGRAHCAPESVVLARRSGRVLCLVGVERADRVLLFDASDARAPSFLDAASTGKRPEGLLLTTVGGRDGVVVCCEGNEGPGEITFLELR